MGEAGDGGAVMRVAVDGGGGMTLASGTPSESRLSGRGFARGSDVAGLGTFSASGLDLDCDARR